MQSPSLSPRQRADRYALLVLDGGLGQLLKDGGHLLPNLPYEQQFLAGALANDADPDTIQRAHATFLEAGAHVCTTNTFVCTEHSLGKLGRAADVERLCQAAGRIARGAVHSSGKTGALVAGCLPPLIESYQTKGLPPEEALQRQYAVIARALLPHVDVLLAETLSTSAEARAVAAATADLGKPLWVSFTLEDSTRGVLRSKEPLVGAVVQLAGQAHMEAVLLNCCTPAAITAALPALCAAAAPQGWRVGAYANGFKATTSQWLDGSAAPAIAVDAGDYDTRGLITVAAYTQHARQWRRMGASIIGGCCGVGPGHISAIADNVT